MLVSGMPWVRSSEMAACAPDVSSKRAVMEDGCESAACGGLFASIIFLRGEVDHAGSEGVHIGWGRGVAELALDIHILGRVGTRVRQAGGGFALGGLCACAVGQGVGLSLKLEGMGLLATACA